MPSLQASCLLGQAAVACGNVKMKHVPALTDPGLTTLSLPGGWPLSSSTQSLAGVRKVHGWTATEAAHLTEHGPPAGTQAGGEEMP